MIPISSSAQKVLAKDPVMHRLLQKVTPKENTSIGDVYVDLLSSIISQQISTKVARVIYSRFLDLFDGSTPSPQQLIDTEYSVLKSVGLSNQKTRYMFNIAQYWIDHSLHQMDWQEHNDEDVISILTGIKGVGVWTAQMILMFTLERPDVLPAGDLAIQQSMIKHYGIESSSKKELFQAMEEIAKVWSPYRTVACLYLWRAKDL